MFQITPETPRTSRNQLNLFNPRRMNQIYTFKWHPSESYSNLHGSRYRIFSFKRKDITSMRHSLVIFKSLLIGYINYISTTNIPQNILFASHRFLSLLCLYNSLHIMLKTHRFVHRWNQSRKDDVRILPLCLTWLAGFVEWSLARDVVLVVGCLVEGWTFWGVADYDWLT